MKTFINKLFKGWGVDKKEEHKNYLINLYSNLINDSKTNDFERLVFQRGLKMLNSGRNPKDVENFVEKLIKIWLYK